MIKKIGRKNLIILACLLMAIIVSLSFACLKTNKVSYAEQTNQDQVIQYEDWLYFNGQIKGYKGNQTELVIPSSINGEKITSVGISAFEKNLNLTKVILSEGLKRIERNAFLNCENLQSVVIPNGFEVIDTWVFGYCRNLKEINLPEGVTMLGSASFYGCSQLTSIKMPSTMTQIGTHIFRGCANLREVVLSENLNSIPFRAFSGCESLREIVIPYGITNIADESFYQAGIENLSLPDSVTNVGSKAFYNCRGLKTLSMKDGVVAIGEGAFEGCNKLEEITLSNNLERIEKQTFLNCSSIKNLNLPKELKSVGERAFANCASIEEISFNAKITSIEAKAFYGLEKLKHLELPQTISSIGESAFEGAKKISKLKIPSGLTKIEKRTFYGLERLLTVALPKGLLSIDEQGFCGCYRLVELINLSSIPIEKGKLDYGEIGLRLISVINEEEKTTLTETENGLVFLSSENENLLVGYVGENENVELPSEFSSKAYKINDYAFYKDYINLITIPKSITEIKDNAFLECERINFVNYQGSYEEWKEIDFGKGNEILRTSSIRYLGGDRKPTVNKFPILTFIEGAIRKLLDILVERIFVVNFILIIFWGVLLIYGGSDKHKTRNRIIFIIIACLQWILISGLRADSIGDDTKNYLNMFDDVSNLSWRTLLLGFWKYITTGSTGIFGLEDIEPLFLIFNKLVSCISTDHIFYKFIIAVIFMGSFGRFVYKYSKDPCLSFILYGSLFYNMFSLTGYRQVLSVALIFFGFDFIRKRKLIPFLLILITAFFLHRTSMVFALLYLFANKKFTSTYLLFVMIILVSMFVLKRQVFEFMRDFAGYEEYVGNYGFKQQTFTIMFALITGIGIWRYNQITAIDDNARMCFNGLILAWFMMPLVLESPSCLRLVYDFAFVLLMIVPSIVETFKSSKDKMLIYLGIYGILLVQVISSSGIYQFFWM